jgi:hypothetical protein
LEFGPRNQYGTIVAKEPAGLVRLAESIADGDLGLLNTTFFDRIDPNASHEDPDYRRFCSHETSLSRRV